MPQCVLYRFQCPACGSGPYYCGVTECVRRLTNLWQDRTIIDALTVCGDRHQVRSNEPGERFAFEPWALLEHAPELLECVGHRLRLMEVRIDPAYVRFTEDGQGRFQPSKAHIHDVSDRAAWLRRAE